MVTSPVPAPRGPSTWNRSVHVPELSTLRKFAFYWRIISLGSAFIRVLWLRAIKRKAERA